MRMEARVYASPSSLILDMINKISYLSYMLSNLIVFNRLIVV